MMQMQRFTQCCQQKQKEKAAKNYERRTIRPFTPDDGKVAWQNRTDWRADDRTPIRQIGLHTSKVENDAGRQYNPLDLQKYDGQ